MRITQAPRIVGKPLEGQPGSAQFERAEMLKLEIQRCLQLLIDASNQAQVDISDLQLIGSGGGGQNAQIHPFLLFGG